MHVALMDRWSRISLRSKITGVTVLMLTLGLLVSGVGTMVILLVTDYALDVVLFETISAFATVGLSTGITADLPVPHQLVLVVLMFTGRTGTITLATALALRQHDRLYRFPQERPIIG